MPRVRAEDADAEQGYGADHDERETRRYRHEGLVDVAVTDVRQFVKDDRVERGAVRVEALRDERPAERDGVIPTAAERDGQTARERVPDEGRRGIQVRPVTEALECIEKAGGSSRATGTSRCVLSFQGGKNQ
ncbi:hypothetical protein GCM10010985_28170 [Caballeronia grimmiae]|uniref:Uncharacterized protein n=1 Tax=Caballeronia grimmiae TaxID=1071679 RepID=A0ABQ1RIZ6_9BURK|nr:hypothetical protein GCM10010985_28170 [Caballeronia grimmiae]